MPDVLNGTVPVLAQVFPLTVYGVFTILGAQREGFVICVQEDDRIVEDQPACIDDLLIIPQSDQRECIIIPYIVKVKNTLDDLKGLMCIHVMEDDLIPLSITNSRCTFLIDIDTIGGVSQPRAVEAGGGVISYL